MAKINVDKFKCFVRYMVNVAKSKKCVPYYEIENVFGLSHKQAGQYAGALGDFCQWNKPKLPPLNGLIISSTDCTPSHGFNWYQEKYGKPWGEILQDCWHKFHTTSSREKQVRDFTGLDGVVSAFLSETTD